MCPEADPTPAPIRGEVIRVRCFHYDDPDASAAGNLADVRVLGAAAVAKLAAAAAEGEALLGDGGSASAEESPVTRVWLAGGAGHYRAEAFGPEGADGPRGSRREGGAGSAVPAPIGFCGHGALAAAFVAFAMLEPGTTELQFANHRQRWRARRLVSPASADSDPVGLVFARPAIVACPPPDFVAACLAEQPVAAATVGDAQGYLIAELSSAARLAALQPDFDLLTQATRRALIVTAADPERGEAAFAFRYFAPQYGPPEDAATGSAAVQLAAYWQPRLDSAQLEARQLSPQGGRMRLQCTPATVELRGRVGYG